MPAYRLVLLPQRNQAYKDQATDQLIAFNAAQCAAMSDEQRVAQPLDVVLLDEHGGLVGGFFGATQWNWLQIGVLWIAEPLRGSGYGTRLVRAAEEEARRRGCRHARVGTFSFQAKEFYERLGYRVVGQLDDYPPGHTDYLLRKDFGASATALDE